MSYLFQIVETDKQPVLSVQTTTSIMELPQLIGRIFEGVVNHIAASGQEPVGPAYIAYFNMDMEHLEIEVGFPVMKEIEGKDNIVLRYIPAGKKATAYHKGSYQDLKLTYEKLTAWMKLEGHIPTGVVYEYYYNSPEEVDEKELLTKIEFLLVE